MAFLDSLTEAQSRTVGLVLLAAVPLILIILSAIVLAFKPDSSKPHPAKQPVGISITR